jgi:hypothetical protein
MIYVLVACTLSVFAFSFISAIKDKATMASNADDDFWSDECNEAAAGTASDQDVVDKTLYIHDLTRQEVVEQDSEKRMSLRKLIREQNELLIKTIMTINLLDPQEADESNKVVSMEDYFDR